MGGPPGMGGPGGWGSRGDRGDRSDRSDKSGDRGTSGGGQDASSRKDEIDDERPNVLRYGKTPKELPSWFTELDTDKDAQIGLYEWRAAGRSIEEFLAKDLNGDGFLTAEEVLKNPTLGAAEAKSDSSKGNTSRSADVRGSNNGSSRDKDKSSKDKDKTNKEEKKPSEPTGNPFLKNKG